MISSMNIETRKVMATVNSIVLQDTGLTKTSEKGSTMETDSSFRTTGDKMAILILITLCPTVTTEVSFKIKITEEANKMETK
jgi:hypothetical protein